MVVSEELGFLESQEQRCCSFGYGGKSWRSACIRTSGCIQNTAEEIDEKYHIEIEMLNTMMALSASLPEWCFSSTFSASFALFAGSIVSTGSPPFKFVFFSPSVRSRDSASAAWWLMPVKCTTSNSNSDKRRRHSMKFSDASARFKIHCSLSWSAWILIRAPSKYGLSITAAQVTAIHSFCKVS